MATNPSVNVTANDGNLSPAINTADEVCLKIAPATGGDYLVPQRFSSTLGVCTEHLFGTLVRSGAHHGEYSGAYYAMRCRASVLGTTSAVVKTPSATYPAGGTTLTVGVQTYTLRTAAGGAVLALNSGFAVPLAPLPLKVAVGASCAPHTQTITFLNEAGTRTVEVLTFTGGGAEEHTTSADVAQVLTVTSSADPGDTSTYTCTHAGPGDRLNALLTCTVGGQVGVSGARLPKYTVSYDGGVTRSRAYTLPTTGIAELLTYAGGLTQQATGLKATFSAGTQATSLYGAIRVAGATVNGDLVFDLKASGVTVIVVVSGMSTAYSVGVVGTVITINSATNGGGTATTTAAYVVANLGAAASALVTATAVGTGLGILAAAASAGAANGGIAWTALEEGVQVKHLRGAAGTAAISISTTVVGIVRSVAITTVTDANGAQTSTANAVVAAVAAHATASTWLTGTASGSGAGIVGCLDTYSTLPVSLATGDTFTFTTTPPKWSSSDLQEALSALLANATWLTYFSVLHVVGESDDTSDNVVATFVQNAATQKKAFKAVVMETTYMGSTSETTWANTLISTFATKSTVYGLAAGEANTWNPAYGTVDRANVGTAYVARLMICPISEQPSHVECDTILGTKYALDGVLVRPNPGDQALWQTDDTLVTLNTSNFITLRQHPGRSGIYVRQGLNFTNDGSDYTYVSYLRISNVARAIAYDQGLRFLNGGFLVDPKTGQMAESECQKLESQISGALRRKLVGNDAGRTHLSSAQFLVQRGGNYVQNHTIDGAIYMVPKLIADTINISTQFSATAR